MAIQKDTDIQFYQRLFRANSDEDGSYLVHADQVQGLNDAIAATTATSNKEYVITGVDVSATNKEAGFKYNTGVKFKNSQVIAESFYATSDARIKENFEPLTTKKSILDLPTYKYDFIKGSKNQVGCKAQDLQEICPELVNEGFDGYLSIQESKIVYLLLDELKKLRAEVDELKARG